MCYLHILKGTKYVDVAFVQGVFLQNKCPNLKNYKKRKQVRSLSVYRLTKFDELIFVELLQEASILLDNSEKAWNI